MIPLRINLEPEEIPKHWYNVAADLSTPPSPPLAPDGQPVSPEQMGAIFPMPILEQEMSAQRWIAIPEKVRQIYALWRPSPLCRALRLEQALGTPAKIFYKYEGVSPAGSHKPNSAVPQAFYNKLAGAKRLTTETGAGQWGSSIAFAGQMFGLPVRVFMVKVSYEQKPFRRSMMQTWGAEVFASPSNLTNAGRSALAADPDNQGSLGLAISEAVEEAAGDPGTCYTLGSVLNHVLLHQSVIGLEAKTTFEKIGLYPDVVIGPCGGGSSFGGIAFPFLADKAAGDKRAVNLRCIAVEPTSCPKLTKGAYTYDYGDVSGYTPIMKMCTLGHDFMPPGIHAGGLRYHGDSPLVSQAPARRADRGAGRAAGRHLRGRRAVRARRGHHPGTGILPRDPRRHRRGLALQGDRRGQGHPVQPHRPRPFRHGLLRPLFLGQARRLRVPGSGHRRIAEASAQGQLTN